MRMLINNGVAGIFLLASIIVNAALCYQYLMAKQEYRQSRNQAQQVAASVAGRQQRIQQYSELRQQASQLASAGVVGVAISEGVMAIQQLAHGMPDAGYSFSTMPDMRQQQASLHRASFEFYAVLPGLQHLATFMSDIANLRRGVFIPQQCTLSRKQQGSKIDCRLEWMAVRQPPPPTKE